MFATRLVALDLLLLGAGVWLAHRAAFRSVPRELAQWTVFAATTAAVFMAAAWSFGLFAVLRGLCHALFCVLCPVVAWRAVRIRRRTPRLAAAALFTALLGEGCYVWALEVEPFRLEVTTARVHSKRLSNLTQPLRIAAVADLQPESIGAHEVAVFDRLVAERPDLVVFLGDILDPYCDTFPAQRERLHAQLARLNPRFGMFAVDGDVDAGAAAHIFAGSAVQVLIDGQRSLPGVPIDLLGLSRGRSRRAALDAGLVRRLATDRFCIVLGHAPDSMRSVLDGGLRADALFVAGHTHGGQVQIPFFGPLVTLSSVPRWLAAGGVFQCGETWLAVSRGIGMEGGHAPRIRFWCRPQLLLLELANAP